MSEVVYLFLDLETTSLDHQDGDILEAAWTFTDQNLVPFDMDAGHAFVRRDHFVFAIRDPNVLRMHSENNLLVDWSDGPWLTPRELEGLILEQIREFGDGTTVQLAGDGVHFDKRWIEHWMPELHRALHYRIGVDVSQLSRFLEGVCGLELGRPHDSEHRAGSDVTTAIERAQQMRALILYLADDEEAIDA